MSRPDFDNDDELFDALANAVVNTDPMPPSVASFGRSVFALIDLESELAELVADSADGELVALRSSETARTVLFRIRDIEIELELAPEAFGSVDPVPEQVTLVTPSGETDLAVSGAGVFRFALPSESFSIRVVVDGTSVRTPYLGAG